VIVYLTTKSGSRIAGDERILELLTHKDEQAQKTSATLRFSGVMTNSSRSFSGPRDRARQDSEQYEAELERTPSHRFLRNVRRPRTANGRRKQPPISGTYLPSLFPTDSTTLSKLEAPEHRLHGGPRPPTDQRHPE